MEIRIKTEFLQKALYRAQGIVERKSSMPILSNVLFDANGDRFQIHATDLEISMKDEYKAEVIEPGRILVPSKQLFEIIRTASGSEINMKKLSSERMEIQSGKSVYRLLALSSDDFPKVPDVSDVKMYSINPEILLEMLDKTHFAVSNDATRHHLNGVFLEDRENMLRMVSTDGHRLSVVEREKDSVTLSKGVIIPKKGISELRRILNDKPESVTIGFTSSNCVFKSDTILLVIRLIDGQFPDFEKVIPEIGNKPVFVEKDSFLSAVKRVKLISGDKVPTVRIGVTDSVLTLKSESVEFGDASEEMDVDYEEKIEEVNFNGNYLVEFLSVIDSEIIKLQISGEYSPGIIQPEDDPGFLAVIMPIRN